MRHVKLIVRIQRKNFYTDTINTILEPRIVTMNSEK